MGVFQVALVSTLCLNGILFACAFVPDSEVVSFQVESEPQEDQDVVVFDDSQGLGRKFEGIGAISGGGATSKLLVNYDKKERDEILDYLFKPNFGASLQIFKVEIGGDMQSTDGTEASHMHNASDQNYHRGYEWWLIQEAKKRNPDIKLYALPWGFPGWIGQGTNNPYINPKQTANYVVNWVRAAKRVYNATIDYIGIWNERRYDITYIKTLRKTLDDAGFQKTLIIASDQKWEISKDIMKDQELASIVHAIGCHYPGTYSNEKARKTKKPLWASEDYSTYNDEVGGGCWARILNQNYVNGLMTSTISWNLIGSYYPHLPFFREGLMTALQPWSGNYVVSTPIWMTAHTTQFVSLGWTYLKHKSGVGKLPKGGSYVGLTNNAHDQLTIVIETMSHDHSICIRPKLPPYKVSPQTITVSLKGAYAGITTMNVWYSKLTFDGSEHTLFQKRQPLTFVNGQAKLDLGVDEVYTLTTLSTGQKGAHPKPPAPMKFPQVIADDFSLYKEFEEPYYLAPQVGSLEVRKINGKSVARQTVTQIPVHWCKAETGNKTISVVGDFEWSSMNMTIKFEIPATNGTSGMFVAARVDRGGCGVNKAGGVFFFVFPNTSTFIVSSDLKRENVLIKGKLPSSDAGVHELSLQVKDGAAVGLYDSRQTFNIDLSTDKVPGNGFIALGSDDYGYFDLHSYILKGPHYVV